MSEFSTQKLRVSYSAKTVIDSMDLTIPREKITTIIGPNAAGKSTLLHAISRLLKPASGQVLLDGKSIHAMRSRDLAKDLGLLPQAPSVPQGIRVAELVARGRHPHHGVFGGWTSDDEEAVAAALLATDTLEIAEENMDELSGGQRQRVWIAMALAQQTDILLLDEPITFLDLKHQVEILNLLRVLNARERKTIVVVIHDVNLAAHYSDHIVALKSGRVFAEGAPEEIVNFENLRVIFEVETIIISHPQTGRPFALPIHQ